MSKIIGILGGMGPLATVDLFEKIVNLTPAQTDQEHIRILIDNNPKIPSRINAILNGEEDPLKELIRSARVLQAGGADFIIIPCHTAHYWIRPLQSALKIPVCNMIENTVSYLIHYHRHLLQHVLLFASTATIKKKLYQQAFSASGYQLIIPRPHEQEVVSAAITQVKASRIQTNPFLHSLDNILNDYIRNREIKAVLGGCTEIPLLFPYMKAKVKKLDPTLMLAEMAVNLAMGNKLFVNKAGGSY